MRVEAGKRTVGFEEKFSERDGCKILQECWKEIRNEGGNMFGTKETSIMKERDMHVRKQRE